MIHSRCDFLKFLILKFKIANFKKKSMGKPTIRDRLQTKLALRSGDKSICLTMIVKNESKNMVRLFKSLYYVLDFISVVDTGSTDDTIEIIETWGKEHNIPTKVDKELFRNFAHNRTHALNAAKAAFPQADYFLLSDADFVWEFDDFKSEDNPKGNGGLHYDKYYGNPTSKPAIAGKPAVAGSVVGPAGKPATAEAISTSPVKKKLLIYEKYLLNQYNDMIDYPNLRLLKGNLMWKCRGVTHEFWECRSKGVECREGTITTFRIHDIGDGGAKNDKFPRDERLFKEALAFLTDKEQQYGDRKEEWLEDQDLIPRYYFYLSETLRNQGKYEEAIETYKKRISFTINWFEESYFALFKMGECYEYLYWQNDYLIKYYSMSPQEWNKYNRKKKDPEYETGTYEAPPFKVFNAEGIFIADAVEKASAMEKASAAADTASAVETALEADTVLAADDKAFFPQNRAFLAVALHNKEILYKKTIEYYEKAHEYLPARAESLAALAKFYRVLSKHQGCYDVCMKGKLVKYPTHLKLFIERAPYYWSFDYELSIICYYLSDKKKEGAKACEKLLDTYLNLPKDIQKSVESNSQFYI